jgi:LPXTG-motif cell wall-anchored protein
MQSNAPRRVARRVAKYRQPEEAVVRMSVRKFVGVALMGLLGALALPMLAAGAQTTGPPSTCTFAVNGTSPNFEVTGTAPAQADVTLYFTPLSTGVTGAVATQSSTTFDFPFTAPETGDISVGYVTTDGNAYTATCATVAGEVVVRVEVGASEATRPAATPAAALAFTGSSDTPSYVLIGIAAVVVGAVLVVAARRRKQFS